jgi:ribosomal protein L12E/L44/L45/RPP1/RPP2
MFRDLKEYQDLAKIYQESVNISDEERKINSLISEANFSEEEINFLIENIDEIELFDEDFIIESNVSQELQEGIGKLIAKGIRKFGPKIVKRGKQIATKLEGGATKAVKDSAKNTSKKVLSKSAELKQRMAKAYDKNIGKKVSAVSGKFSGAVKKIKDIAKKALPFGLAGAVGFGLGKGTSGNKKGADEAQKKIEKDAAIDKQVDDYVKKRQIPGGPKKIDVNKGGEKTPEPPKAPEPPKTEIDKIADTPHSEIKKSGRTAMIKKNIDRFGKDRVQHLQDKQKDFKKMRRGEMSKADFIKAYPNSITAQKAKGLRDHTEWDAYDMVLEYLYSTEQVDSIEEANYVMMEMDHQTIGEIVKEVKGSLIEEGLAKAAVKLGGLAAGAVLAKKGLDKLKKFDPVGDARKKYQDKKATEYEKRSGTTKEDGYFR